MQNARIWFCVGENSKYRECQVKNGINKYWKFALKIDGFELLYIHDTQSIKVGQFKWTESLCVCVYMHVKSV